MRAIVEELDLEQWRELMMRIEHPPVDGLASWVEARAVEFMRVRCRRVEESDDGPHHRREASEAEGGVADRAARASDVWVARESGGIQRLAVTPPRDDRSCGSYSLFEPPTKGAMNG